MTIAELPEYRRRVSRLLSETERNDIVDYLAAYPKAGDLIQGTGGIRKLRWSRTPEARAVASESYTIFTASESRCTC